MRILVGCEINGKVRDAFRAKGHEAYSCDILPDDNEYHITGNVLDILSDGWDMMIAFPPCTHLATSGTRWFKYKKAEQEEALEFVYELMKADIEKIAIENPVSIISGRIRKPDQIIQPWMFGHGECKATCLWLKNLPKLEPTNIVEGRSNRIHMMPESANRSKLRSITYTGIAEAMAEQWSSVDVPVQRRFFI